VHEHNLPAELSSFVGREHELRELRCMLGTTRLLTLVGAGGVGKTRLALRVAAEMAGAYRDGVWQVELGRLGGPDLVPLSVAAAVGVRETAETPLMSSVVQTLRPRHLLLLLDNCEHLLDAGAKLVDDLLRSCPEVKVLATSREPIGITGEAIWRVPSLELPDPEFRATSTCSYTIRAFVSSLSGPEQCSRDSGSAPATRRRSCRSVDGSTVYRWRSSSRRRASTR
jgi:predicted ATPase